MVFDQATNLSQAEVLSHQEQLPWFVVLEIDLLGGEVQMCHNVNQGFEEAHSSLAR